MNFRQRIQSVKKAIFLMTVILFTAALIGCSPSPGIITPTISSLSPSTTPKPSPTPTPTPIPTAIYTPAATPFKPTAAQMALIQYMLDLINKDRRSAGVSPVILNYNAAAQMHAQNMFDNSYGSHWDTNGLKPYMRYTLEGGLYSESENVAYSTGSNSIDVKQELQSLESAMMHDDASSNWSHRNTIISKWQKMVNIGIVYDAKSVALDQEFEGDYLEYFQPPTLTGNILSFSGRFTISNVKLDNVTITFDDLPQPISPADLRNNSRYHHYSLGPQIGLILPPPPPGKVYGNFPANGVLAARWNINQSGQFSIQADISSILSKGKGVYTIVLVTIIGSDYYNMTNYSIFIK